MAKAKHPGSPRRDSATAAPASPKRDSATAGYSGTPLVKKLGIKPGTKLAILGAPNGFRRDLVGLPDDVRIVATMDGAPPLAIWFVRSRREMEGRMPEMSAAMGQGLWVAWPRLRSALAAKSDLNENLIRAAGLANGLVDYKVCAINEDWSGLKFARRSSAR